MSPNYVDLFHTYSKTFANPLGILRPFLPALFPPGEIGLMKLFIIFEQAAQMEILIKPK